MAAKKSKGKAPGNISELISGHATAHAPDLPEKAAHVLKGGRFVEKSPKSVSASFARDDESTK